MNANRLEIALMLRETGQLLKLLGESRFRAQAYLRAASALEGLDADLDRLVAEGRLTEIPGIGPAIAAQIAEVAVTGRSAYLLSLRSRLPPGALEIRQATGLNLRQIALLHEALGVTSVGELRAACEAGRVREVKGFGEKTERKILEAMDATASRPRRALLDRASLWAQDLLEQVESSSAVTRAAIAGDVRRGVEVVEEIVLVAASTEPQSVLERFLSSPLVTRMLAQGIPAKLHVVSPGDFARALIHHTGSAEHVARLEPLETVSLEEREVYADRGLPFIPPELREGRGEIEAARAGTLPRDLVALEDLTGFVHCHTTYSDGKASLERMVRAAESLGAGFITITDHSASAFYARGLPVERLEAQWEEIARLQEKVKVRILRGTEADILADGSIDYPEAILEKLDVVIASIHSRFGMDRDRMTKRIVRALENPLFKIWGHPLGRLLERRPPVECDMEAVLDAAASTRTAIEINGDPRRLDLPPSWIREARERGIPFVVATDAHSVGGLRNARYGVVMARRGWVRRGEVLNALPVDDFIRAVRPRTTP